MYKDLADILEYYLFIVVNPKYYYTFSDSILYAL